MLVYGNLTIKMPIGAHTYDLGIGLRFFQNGTAFRCAD